MLRNLPGSRMNYMRLLKLLYVVERESIQESGRPLMGGGAVAMQRGPVLEDMYSLIRGQHEKAGDWTEFFHTEHYDLVMHHDPGNDMLTPFLASKLGQIAERYQDCDEWAMVEETHKLLEWQKNDPGESSKPIPLSDILDAVGRTQDAERIISFDMSQATAARLSADCG